jgi:hypothetical protein
VKPGRARGGVAGVMVVWRCAHCRRSGRPAAHHSTDLPHLALLVVVMLVVVVVVVTVVVGRSSRQRVCALLEAADQDEPGAPQGVTSWNRCLLAEPTECTPSGALLPTAAPHPLRPHSVACPSDLAHPADLAHPLLWPRKLTWPNVLHHHSLSPSLAA